MSNLTPEDMKEIARIVREEVTAVLHPSVRAQQEAAFHAALPHLSDQPANDTHPSPPSVA